MNNNIHLKLWVVKFCLKLVYPKFNCYTFLVFLAIKYRLRYSKSLANRRVMDVFEVKTISPYVHRQLLKEHLDENIIVLEHKCILISKEQFIELASENLFYIDNGVLWLTLRLSNGMQRKHTNIDKSQKINSLMFSLNIVTSEIHKKLWAEDNTTSLDNVRVVPIVGSKSVEKNVALFTENEFYNIISTFGLDGCKNVEVTFHPIPSFENAPIIAATAEVNLIVNEDDIPNDFIKEILSNYFETPKILSTNDVFSVDLTPTMTAKYHYKYADLERSSGKLFFKCGKLTSYSTIDMTNTQINKFNLIQVYFIVKNVTQLILGENIHALKPKDEYFRPQETGNNVMNLYLCPTGLREKFEQMQETISPFITGDINDLSSSMPNPIIPMLLLTGSTGSGRHLIVQTLAKYNGMNCLQTDCNALQSSTAKQTERKINSTIQKAKASAPAIVMLNNFEVFAVDPEHNEDCRIVEYFIKSITDLYQNYTKHPIIFVAVTEKFDLKPNISRMFLEKFHLPMLNVQQRCEMLQWFASVMQLHIDGDEKDSDGIFDLESKEVLSKSTKDMLQRVAAKTETFLYGDLDTLVHFALRESYLKQLNSSNSSSDPQIQHVKEEDFNLALESIRSLQSQHLDAPKIPKVHWEDIGGLDKLKKELLKTIEFPIKYPHLFKNSTLKRSGILLYGPPGCGKTLVAKAVSTELNVSFLSVKGPELLNMYIGQSEENVREVFERARASSPCIVFLDELDALAPRRGAAGDSGGASDRVVSQLLAELDGVNSAGDADSSFVFVMGATNRPDLLEQSLLRPGRLDKLIYVGPYCGLEEKTCVLKALCRSYKLRPEVNLVDVAAALPDRCTGADLLQVVSMARSAAVRALVAKLHSGAVKESDLSPNSVILGVSELWHGVQRHRPSVTEDELAYYESLQSQM